MKAWLQRNRASVRVAFVLKLAAMIFSVVLSLVWSRLLLRAMGDPLNGLFIAFQGVARLGGLGDLGMGGAVALRSGQMLGAGDEPRLRSFLANARAVFLALAIGCFAVLFFLSPWMPGWLRFEPVANSGSLTLLFIVGAFCGGLLILNSYFQNLNYAYGNVVWPILPGVVLTQVACFCHWLLARAQAPMWIQYLPYLGALAIGVWVAKKFLDWSHASLGNLTPLRCDRAEWGALLTSSGWVYLCSLGNLIYTTTDRFVLNAGFGPAIIPTYYYNYKACELATGLVLSAGFVSMPKITQWLASREAVDQQRARSELGRVNQFQIVLGCAAACAYLAINDVFVRFWLGTGYHAPLIWQVAFACNLAVTVGGDAAIQMAGRCGAHGIRTAGLAIGGAGMLNLLLAIAAARSGSIAGIATATVIAQSVLSLTLAHFTCRYLGLPRVRWMMKSWLLPLGTVLAAAGLKQLFPDQTAAHIGILLAGYAGLLVVTAVLAGFNRDMVRAEIATLRGMLKI